VDTSNPGDNVSEVIYEAFSNMYYDTLLLLRDNVGLFSIQWSGGYDAGVLQGQEPAENVILWALSEYQHPTGWDDLASMAQFVLGYFPESEVVLAALGNA